MSIHVTNKLPDATQKEVIHIDCSPLEPETRFKEFDQTRGLTVSFLISVLNIKVLF